MIKQPTIEAEVSEPSFEAAQAVDQKETNQIDIEMTDEQKDSGKNEDVKEEEIASPKVPKKKVRSRAGSFNPGLEEASVDKSALDPLDLHELIKKNNGTDVELQFYFKGKMMPANTCFYEIF